MKSHQPPQLQDAHKGPVHRVGCSGNRSICLREWRKTKTSPPDENCMSKLTISMVLLLVAGVACETDVFSQATSPAEREAMYRKYLEFQSYIKGGRVEPHWLADGNSFWFAEETPNGKAFWKVEPQSNYKQRLFDTQQLLEVLKDDLETDVKQQDVSFDNVNFERRKSRHGCVHGKRN